MDYLRSVCPAASSLYFVPSFDLPKCHNGYPIPLHDSSYDKEAILEELLFCSPETVQEYKEHVIEADKQKGPVNDTLRDLPAFGSMVKGLNPTFVTPSAIRILPIIDLRK